MENAFEFWNRLRCRNSSSRGSLNDIYCRCACATEICRFQTWGGLVYQILFSSITMYGCHHGFFYAKLQMQNFYYRRYTVGSTGSVANNWLPSVVFFVYS